MVGCDGVRSLIFQTCSYPNEILREKSIECLSCFVANSAAGWLFQSRLPFCVTSLTREELLDRQDEKPVLIKLQGATAERDILIRTPKQSLDKVQVERRSSRRKSVTCFIASHIELYRPSHCYCSFK